MPENFEIAYLWVFLLIPLPLLIYWLFPPLRIKSASLQVPNLDKTASITGLKPRKSALISRKNAVISVLLFIV